MKYDYILFDLDNTLVDFSDASRRGFRELLQERDMIYSKKVYQTFHEINYEVWSLFELEKIDAVELRSLRFERFFNKIGNTSQDPSEFNAAYLEKILKFTEAYKGVIDLLSSLKANYEIGIITNGLKEIQRRRIQKTGLDPFLSSITVSDEVGCRKPQKAIFDIACGHLPVTVPKDRILIVGDSFRSDIVGGKNFGLSTCWITDLIPSKSPKEADILLAKATELKFHL